jgi:hypothetical protein
MWPSHRKTAEILQGDDVHHPVVQLRNREFPALAIQGDTLLAWVHAIRAIAASAEETGDEILLRRIAHLKTMIEGAFDSYNQTCKKHGRGGF